MTEANRPLEYAKPPGKPTLWDRWTVVPLYQRIIIALILGIIAGLALGPRAEILAAPARLLLRILGALATPLILVAVMQAVMQARVGRADALRIARLLLLNTLVAIIIGLFVANVIRPGKHAHLDPPAKAAGSSNADGKPDPIAQILNSVPDSILRPLVDNNVIGVILLGVAFGLALRSEAHKPIKTLHEVIDLAFATVVRVLKWVIAWIPLAVFGIVAGVIGTKGFQPFVALAVFIVTVLSGLLLQLIWYLARIRIGSWVRPLDVLRGTRDALVMAFSTDSSAAAMPVTYSTLVEKVGLREKSASLGALVGTNFNNDGTALYEAVSALFIAQLVGRNLTLGQQVLVVLTSVLASVGAAGIPEAGTVTMTLVLTAVKLPVEYIPLLLTVDWFLDRCRTVLNVLGDVNVSCLLDGHERGAQETARVQLSPESPDNAAPPQETAVAPGAVPA